MHKYRISIFFSKSLLLALCGRAHALFVTIHRTSAIYKAYPKTPPSLHYIIPRCFFPLPFPIASHVPLNFHETLALNPFSCCIASSAAHPGARSHLGSPLPAQFDPKMAVSAFRSTSKKGSNASPSRSAFSPPKEPVLADSRERIPPRRSRSVSAAPRRCPDPSPTPPAVSDYSNTRNNPLFGCPSSSSSSSPESESRVGTANGGIEASSSSSRRGRPVSIEGSGNRRIRSVSRGHHGYSEVLILFWFQILNFWFIGYVLVGSFIFILAALLNLAEWGRTWVQVIFKCKRQRA